MTISLVIAYSGTRRPVRTDCSSASQISNAVTPSSAVTTRGASPRATLYLNLASRANAMLHGRAYATPQDVKDIAHDVLRHRIILTYEAEAEEQTTDDVVARILNEIPVP